MTTEAEIPHRLRRTYCEQFVPTLLAASRSYPASFRVQGYKLSMATLAARLRDAILSMDRYKWGPDGLPKFVVTMREGGVFLQADGASLAAMTPASGASLTSSAALTLSSLELEAFCILLSSERIVGPVTVTNDFDALYLANLEASHNIAITHDLNTNTFIVL